MSESQERDVPGDGADADLPELVRQWWSWAMGRPVGQDPVTDPTGARAGQGQSEGPVWLVAGTLGGDVQREWTMPAGRRLFVPAVCAFTVPFLFLGRSPRLSVDSAHVELDSVPQHLVPLRVRGLTVRAAAGNPFTESDEPQELRIVSEGLWALTAPLTPGSHELAVGAVTGDGFALDVSCRITAIG